MFKNIASHTNVVYTDIASDATRKESYSYNGGRIGAQFMAGLGYNFKAIGENVFSVEANLKMYLTGGYATVTRNIYTLCIKLNWYFIK